MPPAGGWGPMPGAVPPGGPSGFRPGAGPMGPNGWGPAGAPGGYFPVVEVRHRPGPGAVVAAVGLLMVLMALFGLPWISGGGQDVSFPDIREAISDNPIDAGGTSGDYIEFYADGFWVAGVALAVGAGVTATLLVPSSAPARMVIGFLTGGLLGVILMAADKDGRVAPKLCGAFLLLGSFVCHGLAIHELFDGTGTSPAYGVWFGAVGHAVLLVGCFMGTRIEQPPAPRFR